MNNAARELVEMTMEPSSRRFPSAAQAFVLYVLLATALTWPLGLHFTDRVPAGDNDLWQNYWNIAWWKAALFEEHRLPYRTDWIYQPGEASLAFHTHSEANVVPAMPIAATLGIPAALNLSILASMVFSAWGAYFLARELVGNRGAAFVAGVVFGCFPNRMEQSLEHWNLVSLQAAPFFLLYLLRLVRLGGARNILLTALFFALNALYAWHNGLLFLPFAAILAAAELVRSRRPPLVVARDVGVAAAIALVVLAPFAAPMVREILAGETYYLKPPVKKGIDLLFLVVPSELHSFWGSAVRGLYDRFRTYDSAGFTAYLGLPALVLAAAAFGRRRSGDVLPGNSQATPAVRFAAGLWAGIFILYVALACGDSLTVAGRETGVPMPFAALRALPILKTIRVPNRCIAPAMLALAVLAAAGTARLLAARAAPNGGRRGLGWVLAAALIVLDYLGLPFPTRDLPRPAWADAVAREAPGLLLQIPSGYRARAAEDMYYQTIHGHPLVGGYASCTPPAMEKRIAELPYLKLIFEGRPQVDVRAEAGLEPVLRALPIQLVTVHRDRSRERLEAMRAAAQGSVESRRFNPEKGASATVIEAARAVLRRTWGSPIYADADVELYRRP